MLNEILLLLILIISSKFINSQNNSLHQEKEFAFNETCKNINPIFCSMRDAINYLTKTFKSSPPKYNTTTSTIGNDIEFSYNKISSPNIICNGIEIEEENLTDSEIQDIQYLMKFKQCNVLTYGYIDLKFFSTQIVNNELFFAELNFDSIILSQRKRATKGEVNITFISDNKYNYDKQNEIFGYTIVDLTKSMDNYMTDIFNVFQDDIKKKTELDSMELTTQIKYLTDTINFFYKNFSSFDIELNDNENKITYIAYNDIEYDSFINIQDRIFIPKLFITFEYALNYNITYNEGNLTVRDISFSKPPEIKDSFGDYEENYAEFNNLSNEKEVKLIWDTIYTDFKAKFKEYKKLSLITIIPESGVAS